MNKDNEIIDIDEVVVSNTKNNILKEMTKPLKYSALPTLTVDDVMKTRSFTLEDLGVGEKRDANWLEQIGIGVDDTVTEIGLLDEQVKMSVGRIYAEPETTRKEAMTRLSTIPVDFPLGNVNYTPISDKPLAQVEELAQTKLTQEQVEEIHNVNNTWGARLMRSAKKNIDNERLGHELSLTHITPDDRQSGLAQASAAISQGIFQAALASIPLVGKVASASYMGASTFGAYTDKSLEQYREKTGDMDLKQFGYNRTDEESMSDVLAGLGYSAISAILEYKLGTERLIWQGAEKLGIKGTAGAIGKIALQEGIEEGLQQVVEYPMRWLAGTNDSTVQEMAQEIITSAVFGAIAGGVVGGGTFRIQRSRLSQLYADKIREQVKNNPELKKIFPDEKTIKKTANSAAEQSITDAYTGVADEITTVNELQNAFGDSFDYLVSKFETVLINAGWQQKFPDRDVHEYATVNAQRLAHDVLRQSRLLGVKTSDVLKLSEIEVSDNILYLRPQRLGSVQAIQDTIDEKKKELKDLRRLAKIGGGNPERVSTLNAQIVILQSLLNRRYGIDIQQSSRRIAKQANADQAVIQSVAPATAEELNTIKDATDDESFVYVGNKRVPVVYEVRELSDVIPSHIAGIPNKEYQLKALQNRESRSTQADVAVLRERAGNLHPEELLDAPNTQFGAPIVNERGEIIAGNGRYEVLRTAYQENLSKKGIEKYKKSLKKLGFEIDGFKMPILVRSTSGLTETQQIAVADASNVSITSEFDHASRAKQDAKLLSGANNLLEFAEKIPLTDRQGLFLNNGKWDMVALQRRYDDALMMWLCGNDASLFEDLVLGGGITNKIIQGLVSRGSLLYEFDKQYPEVGLREDIELALRKAPFVKNKLQFANMIAQVEMDGRNVFPENAFLHSFVYAKTATQISEFVELYTDKSANNIKASETGLFGESAPQFTKYDLLAQTMRESTINQGKFKEDGSTEDGALQAVFLSSQDQFAGQEQISYSDFARKMLNKYMPNWEQPKNEFDIAYENTPIDQKIGYRRVIRMGDLITILIIKASAGKNKGKFYANRTNRYGDIELLTEEGWKTHQGGTVGFAIAKTFDTIEDLQKAISDTYNVAERAEQPTQLFHESFDIADENARLDDIYPEYTGESIKVGIKITNSQQAEIDKMSDLQKNSNIGQNLQGDDIESFAAGYLRTIEEQRIDEEYVENLDARGRTFEEINEEIEDSPDYNDFNRTEPFANEQELKDWFKKKIDEDELVANLDSDGWDSIKKAYQDTSQRIDFFDNYVNLVKNILQSNGYYVESSESRVSDSKYIKVYESQEDLDSGNFIEDIRISDHDTHKDYGKKLNLYTDRPINEEINKIVDRFGKERTVYNSNGERIAKSAEALRNFWNWFGDSGIKYKGRPLVVYHGTNAQFDTFNKIKVAENGYGFYFSSDTGEAGGYGEIMPVYLKINNPAPSYEQFTERVSDEQIQNIVDKYIERFVESKENKQMALDLANTLKAYPKTSIVDRLDGLLDLHLMSDKDLTTDELDLEIRKITTEITGYDGYFYAVYDEGGGHENYVAWQPNQIKSTQNRGTFSPDTGNIYHQGVSKNGFYDSELKTIVLGRNFNLGTLPHELAHFWLDELFLNYKLASSSSGATPKWVKEVESLFAYLGIDKNQKSLTREQHEKFATTMEAVVFGLAKAPDGMQLPITDYMNWIPQKYTSIRAIGYRDKNGIVRNPLLDKNGADFFNAWFSNPSLPALTSSPVRDEATNPVKEDGEIIPSTPDVIKQREEQVNSAIAEQEKLDNEIRESLQEELPVEAKSAINAEYTKYDEMSGLKLETLPKDKSWFKQGKRHIREEMAKKAREYVKKNTDHAREVALIGKPALNDTGVDLESLILAVMEYDNVDAKSELGLTYTHNIAMTRSEAGTTLGLHAQDGSYQVYLDGYRRMKASMTETAAYKYAGRGVDSVNKLESDIKALCAKYADAVDNGSMTQERALKVLVAEASLKFTGEEDTTILNQIDIKQAGKTRGAFIAYAERLVRRDIAKTEPNIEMQNKLLDLAPAVQQASIDINSKDLKVSCAGAEKMREWYDLVSSVDVQKTFLSGAINSYAPRAMLSGISTHTTNVISNTIEQGMLRPAIALHYGENIIPKETIEAEKERIKAVYNSTFMNLTTMITPTDPSLIHGEKYKPLDPKATGLNKVYDLPMRWLSAEDNLFRIPTYLDVASRMASRDANGDAEKAIELFKQYTSTQPKKINGEENPMYAKRAELITMSAFATFTQNGKLAGALTKMRNALNSLSVAGYELQLGTIIAPFIKTPANIIASGLRSPFGAGVALVKKIAGKELTFQESVDSAHFIGLALLALLASAFCDYEPPYKGGKYDSNKPYDSIGVGGVWIKLNTFGVLEAPMRIWLNVWHNRKFEILETLGNVPLVGELVDNRLSYATNAPVSWGAGTLYNQGMKLIPALVKQLIKPVIKATGAETELEDLDFGIKTGIGRKIERTFGLDGSEFTYNDLIAIVFNRLKIY